MTRYAEDSDTLAGGRWVADKNGVQRWVSDTKAGEDE